MAIPPAKLPQVRTKFEVTRSHHELSSPQSNSDLESLVREKSQTQPPNGGLQAWLQVMAAFCIWFNTWGLLAAYGVYQEYYESIGLASPSDVSWIGSLQGGILLLGSLVTGYLYDLGYLRSLLWVGHGFLVLGMMLTSVGTKYWHFVLTQGVMVGLGASCLFLPCISILQQYFSTRKSLATGIASTGNAIGGMIFPVIFRALVQHVEFAWATRVLAFICLAFSIPPVVFMRLRSELTSSRTSLLDTSLFHDAPYLAYCAAIAATYAGIYVALFFLPSYALTVPGSTSTLVSSILVVANVGSLIGRLAPGVVADYAGPLNVMLPTGLVSALLGFAWLTIGNVAGLILWAVMFGMLTGAMITLGGPVMVAFTPDLRNIGARLGFFGLCAGVGMLISAPIAGKILESSSGWAGLQAWCGACLFAAVGFLFLARCLKVGWRLSKI